SVLLFRRGRRAARLNVGLKRPSDQPLLLHRGEVGLDLVVVADFPRILDWHAYEAQLPWTLLALERRPRGRSDRIVVIVVERLCLRWQRIERCAVVVKDYVLTARLRRDCCDV